jgi:hypothetical protein
MYCYWSSQVKVALKGWACGLYGRRIKDLYKILVGKTAWKATTRKTGRKWDMVLLDRPWVISVIPT